MKTNVHFMQLISSVVDCHSIGVATATAFSVSGLIAVAPFSMLARQS
jgi:hypothetical protein